MGGWSWMGECGRRVRFSAETEANEVSCMVGPGCGGAGIGAACTGSGGVMMLVQMVWVLLRWST